MVWEAGEGHFASGMARRSSACAVLVVFGVAAQHKEILEVLYAFPLVKLTHLTIATLIYWHRVQR